VDRHHDVAFVGALWQRLMTVSVIRWLKMSIVPLPGSFARRTPGQRGTRPPNAPAAETTILGRTVVTLPLPHVDDVDAEDPAARSVHRDDAVIRPGVGAARAGIDDVASISCHGSSGRVRTRNARRIARIRAGSRALSRCHRDVVATARRPLARAGKPLEIVVGSSGVATK